MGTSLGGSCGPVAKSVSFVELVLSLALYRDLVEAHFEPVVVTPDFQSCSCRNRNRPLIQFPQSIHLLHVLPVCAAEDSRSCFLQFNVVEPKFASININAHLTQHELVCRDNRLSTFATGVICKIETAAHEIDVALEYRNVSTIWNCIGEQLLHSWKLVQLRLEVDIINPYLALNLSVTSNRLQL